jgi:hypothetical protein
VQVVAVALEDVVLLDADLDVQVARGPPLVPGSPLPAERMRMPSLMPAGILTSSVFCFLILPAPLQLVQGSGMILPVPWQCGQVCWMLKKPWRMCTVPAAVAGAAGLGAGAGLGAAAVAGVAASSQVGMRICVSLPKAASSSVISIA